MTDRRLRQRITRWTLLGLLTAFTANGQQSPATMLVHLPSAPVESAGKQAIAVNALADHLSTVLPNFPLEAKIFRRLADAQSFLESQGETVALALSDASLVEDLPTGLEPSHRFVHGGSPTYRRVVVVRSDREEMRLLDLQGASLAVVETAGPRARDFLGQQVFSGALDPAAWFQSIAPADDDFAATASVLYGQTDAALVAEYNPLLREKNLQGELREIYKSPPLSLPTLSVRATAFNAEQRSALDRALGALSGTSALLADLGLDGLEKVADRRDLLAPPQVPRKRLGLAAPVAGTVTLADPALPDPGALPFVLAIELPDVEIDPEALAGPNSSN